MALTREKMLELMQTKDAKANSKFIVGVLTTGIYCVPSCPSRTPLAKNVRFFENPEAAAAFGLRACKRCQPNETFYGIDPEEKLFERLLTEVTHNPGAHEGTDRLAKWLGVGATRLNNGTRKYLHATPLELLQHSRIRRGQQLLLASEMSACEVGAEVGYQTPSAFYESFGRFVGMAPVAYRKLRSSTSFEIALPEPFPLERWRAYLNRDEADPTLRLENGAYVLALNEPGEPQVRFTISGGLLKVEAESNAFAAHQRISRLIGLGQSVTPLERANARLVGTQPGLRVFLAHSVFDALAWSIVGQQLNLGFAMKIRKRLYELVKPQSKAGRATAPLVPTDLLGIEPGQLLPLQFSGRKAEYLLDVSKRITEESLDIEEIAHWTATRAERWLHSVRGLGPWSVHYTMMRGCGFANCVPVGDTSLSSALVNYFSLEAKPKPEEFLTLMKRFEPHRSLATFHLWYGHSGVA